MELSKRFKITVCCDGFVSIVEDMKHRRLNAALPAHSVDSIELALELVKQTTELRVCRHKGKLGTTIEPRAKCWPVFGDADDDIEYVQDFAEDLQRAEKQIEHKKRTGWAAKEK